MRVSLTKAQQKLAFGAKRGAMERFGAEGGTTDNFGRLRHRRRGTGCDEVQDGQWATGSSFQVHQVEKNVFRNLF